MAAVSGSSSLSYSARIYIGAVVLAGAVAVALSIKNIIVTPPPNEWYWVVTLTLLSGVLPVKLPSVAAIISVSETFVFAGTLIFGPAVGTVLVLLDAIVISTKVALAKRQVNWTKIPFNLAAPPLSIWLASIALFGIAGPAPLTLGSAWFSFVLGLAVFTVLYFLLNSGFIALAIAIQRGHGPLEILRDLAATWRSIKDVFWNYLAGASIAALLVSGETPANGLPHTISVKFLLLILPLMVVLYLTYRNTAQRVESIQMRLDAVEKVHMSTIAAFAMAIDAKDQVTHGHIRRVQRYTMELAKSLGVKDDRQLKALEAAALLHDTGKLAVPEYILNKPGPLTASEFEKMKDHAAVGANILKTIEFPYPVEPVVRHHHENWDGSGYPDGLKGQDIPLGARILSVVDCYDALTSDRPYRPRMIREQAEQILRDRRGTMYDAWIVDTFLKILDRLQREDRAEANATLTPMTAFHPLSASQLDVISAATAEEREFAELRRELLRVKSFAAAAEVVFRHLRRVIPAATVVMFVPSAEGNELVCAYSAGMGASTIESTRVPVGGRISGWAFAHKQVIVNSDASLDLGPVARTFSVPLKYALVAPLSEGKNTFGVLALYGSDVFSKDHTRMLESAAGLLTTSIVTREATDGFGLEQPITPVLPRVH